MFCESISEADNRICAQKYDYGKQIIDEQETFELFLDNEVERLNENRKKLNSFDSRPQKEVLYVRRLVWLIDHFGLHCAKAYHYVCTLYRRLRKRL